MKLRDLKLAAAVLLIISSSLAAASPSLIGSSATYDNASVFGNLAGITASPLSNTVGAGPEFGICVDGPTTDGCANTGLFISIDIDASSIRFDFSGSTGTDGTFRFDLTDLDFLPAAKIIGVSQDKVSLNQGTFVWSDFGDSFVSFEGDGVTDIDAINGVSILFDLEVQQTAPEPGMLALLGLALAGMGFSRRRAAA